MEYFKGSKLVDTLLGPKYKGKLATETPIKSRAEAAKLAQELLRLGFFHRSQRVTHAHTRRWELEMLNGPFEEDGLYTWVYEGAAIPFHGAMDASHYVNYTCLVLVPRIENQVVPDVCGHAVRRSGFVHDPDLATVAQGGHTHLILHTAPLLALILSESDAFFD